LFKGIRSERKAESAFQQKENTRARAGGRETARSEYLAFVLRKVDALQPVTRILLTFSCNTLADFAYRFCDLLLEYLQILAVLFLVNSSFFCHNIFLSSILQNICKRCVLRCNHKALYNFKVQKCLLYLFLTAIRAGAEDCKHEMLHCEMLMKTFECLHQEPL
jgi:hypothetical protein